MSFGRGTRAVTLYFDGVFAACCGEGAGFGIANNVDCVGSAVGREGGTSVLAEECAEECIVGCALCFDGILGGPNTKAPLVRRVDF